MNPAPADRGRNLNTVMAQSSFENMPIADIVKKVIAAKRYISRYDGSSKPKQLKKLKDYKAFLLEIEKQKKLKNMQDYL